MDEAIERNHSETSRSIEHIISTHDGSPVAPNVESAVGGVASLLFVYAVA